MKVNLLPAIKAYAEERIKQLSTIQGTQVRIQELESICKLCDGLTAQQQVFDQIANVSHERPKSS